MGKARTEHKGSPEVVVQGPLAGQDGMEGMETGEAMVGLVGLGGCGAVVGVVTGGAGRV